MVTPPPVAEPLDPAALGAFLIPVVLVGLDRLDRRAPRTGAAFLAVSLAVVLVVGAILVRVLATDVLDPPETDFLAFWLPARAAAHGLNFYDPASYRVMASSYDPEFRAEILATGFWYPPPAMFLAFPIGLLAVHEAALAWFSLQLAALVASTVLLWRAFLPGSGPRGLLGCAALMLLLRTTFTTLDFGQTNFLELLWLLGFWHDRDRARGGVWLALAVVTKPFALALVAFLAIRRRWAGIATAFGTLAALMLAAVAAFGVTTSVMYFRSNPMTRLPAYVYSQDVNQSLWGTLLRLRGLKTYPLAEPARGEMLVAAGVVLTLTAWAALRRTLDERLLFAFFLTTGLILYPTSLEHYSVVLLLPILMAWARPEAVPWGRFALGIVVVTLYLLIGIGSGGVFWAYGVLWLALLAAAAARGARTRPRET